MSEIMPLYPDKIDYPSIGDIQAMVKITAEVPENTSQFVQEEGFKIDLTDDEEKEFMSQFLSRQGA